MIPYFLNGCGILRIRMAYGKRLLLVSTLRENPLFWLSKNKMTLISGKKLLSLRDIFYKYCKTEVGNGLNTSFWKSTWLGNQPLSIQFPVLFDLTYDKDVSVKEVFTSKFESLTFRRRIVGNLRLLFDELINYCNQVSLSDHDDKIVWTLGKKASQLILCTERKWKIKF
ncbi:hypothetical protein Zm00014a_015219 [Zea mays]|jgi:hypothetical protein|uniref:Uncharacterized protein n=1 Tax=Zea mays TaxID=4577 RepID=A0A3L6D9N9_MAIZE|nr:hypothetical protein Zm00014a_015219 [Zea mays]